MNPSPQLWGNCWRCGAAREGDSCVSCGAQRNQDPFLGVRGGPVRLARHLMTCPNVVYYRAQGARGLSRLVRALPQSLQPDRAVAQRFILLGRALKEVRHPNLMEVYQVEAAPDRHAWLMGEWMEGHSAELLLRQSEPMDLGRAMLLGEQMLCGLEQLHKLGYVHGRVGLHAFHMEPPDAQQQDGLRMVDLGLGILEEQMSATRPAALAGWRGGSPWERWQTPELLSGAPPTFADDVYAVAMCIYELLSGHLAYRHAPRQALLAARAGEELERVPLIERCARFKRYSGLCDVIDRAISALPSERFRDAASLRSELALGARQLSRPRRVNFVKKEASAEPRPAPRAPAAPVLAQGGYLASGSQGGRARVLKSSRRAPASLPVQEHGDFMGRCSRLLMSMADSLRQQSAQLPRPRTQEVLVPLLRDFALADRLEASLSRARDSDVVFAGPLSQDVVFASQDADRPETFPVEVDEQEEWSLEQVLSEEQQPGHADSHAWLVLSVASPLLRQLGGKVPQGEQSELRRSLEPLAQVGPEVREVNFNERRGILSFVLTCGDSPRSVLSKLLLFLMEFGRRSHTRPPALALVIRWRSWRGDGLALLPKEEEQEMVDEAEEAAFRGYDGELLAPREVVMLSGAEELFAPLQGSRRERMSRDLMIWSFAG